MTIFKISGYSMEPHFNDGDLVCVTNKEYKDEDVVIAYIEIEKRYVIKRIKNRFLVGDNLEHSTVYNLDEAKILGKVEMIDFQTVMAADDISLKGVGDKNNYFTTLI